jgi:flagellar hook-associated protein 2
LDSHKKSELKNIYNSILKLNKEAPLYIFDRSEQTKGFAVSLKENARQLQHTILEAAGTEDSDFLKSQVAYSSNDNILSAKYIGGYAGSEDIPSYEIEVDNLASPQVNVGNHLPSSERSIEPGSYSFDISTGGMGYEFQFNINEDDTNYDIQSKLARLVNHANIGLTSTVLEGVNDTSSLQIASQKTGAGSQPDAPLFTISDDKTSMLSGSVAYLGLDYIAQNASDAHFTVNGVESSSSSNHFTIEKNYDITLNGVSPEGGESVTVGVKPNTESLKDNVRFLIGGYNSFMQAVAEYTGTGNNSNRLVNEMSGIARSFTNELDAIGITREEDGSLSIDENQLSQAAESEEAKDVFLPLKDFSASLYKKSENVSYDPMNYANKTLVAYKNPGRNFPSPYALSSYSGMLFSYYC